MDVNLWMPVPATQDVQDEMHEVLQSGKTLTIQKNPGMISVLAPVRDSLNQIVGLVEVVSSAAAPHRDER